MATKTQVTKKKDQNAKRTKWREDARKRRERLKFNKTPEAAALDRTKYAAPPEAVIHVNHGKVIVQHPPGSRAWLLAFFEEQTKLMVEVMRAKNADYAGSASDSDAFANFARVEALGIATTEQGFLTRMTDKICRVATFAKKGILQVKDESVEDTLRDLANYSLLMLAYVRAKKERANAFKLAA